MSYSKLHASVVNSSLWSQPDSVRILFMTLLATCDRDGICYGTKSGLSRLANIEFDDIDMAWNTLMSPDKESSDKIRAPENEGRRIEEVSGGFKLLNFAYYRGLRNEDDRRDQNREAQARFKEKNKAKVIQGKPQSATVSQGNPPKAHAESEPEAEAGKTPLPPKGEDTSKHFDSFWHYYPRKEAKVAAWRSWKKQKLDDLYDPISRDVIRRWPNCGDGMDKKFIPMPATYLNQRRWEDEIDSKSPIKAPRRISADHPDELPVFDH